MSINELDKKYDSKKIEKDKYEIWLSKGYFKPLGKGEPFCIILPPPNVTGILHLGHAWDASIQDTIIRYKKLKGFRTLWIPGTDHAGIATQTRFEKYLKENNLPSRIEIGRKEFINQLLKWKDTQANTIKQQWQSLGLSLDYSNQKFTMDHEANKIVNKVFVELYNNKLIYKGLKLVNWDVKLQTAISDIEVIYKPVKTKLYYFKYFLDNKKKKFIEIATTRPETMFGDVCVFVNPNDKRYKKIINKTVLNPINDKPLIVLADKYIDINFGSGAMKCTPAHDFNDYELAKKYNLDLINIMNNDGKLNDSCGEFNNVDRLKAREHIVEFLRNKGCISKIDENYETQIGYSERTNEIVEPILSQQWFLHMKPLAKKIIDNQKKKIKNKYTEFLPKRFDKTLITWLENIEDWCISRQLWWGHQLPVWYHKETNEIYVGENEPKNPKDWTRESDVLDTWFSSGLWPLICLDWNTKNNKKFNEYFPTSILVTGYDIIFFWVSRMMMLSNYFTNKTPFQKVYIHGLIRDENGRKMSKSLGNGINPEDIINEYGADTLRLFLTSSSSIGEDLNFSYAKVKSSWNFLNKLWNSARFILGNIDYSKKYNIKLNKLNLISIWILNKYNKMITKFTNMMDEYNFVVANKVLYDFIWNDFCNIFIELSKVLVNNKQEKESILSVMLFILKNVLILLHPQCPFITEEIYQKLPNKTKLSIMKEIWPSQIENIPNENVVNILNEIINVIRRIRTENNINLKQKLEVNILTKKKIKFFEEKKEFINNFLIIVNSEIKNISNIAISGNKISEVVDDFTIEIPFNKNYDEEILKLRSLIVKLEAEVDRSNKILSNNNFISKAPKQKVDEEKNKLKLYQEQLKNALDSLNNLLNVKK